MALIAVSALAQTPIVPLSNLVANQGSVTAGPLTFSNFKMPKVLPYQGIAQFLTEFNDLGISAITNPDGTVSLQFVFIDPTTGLITPIQVGGANGVNEFVRLVSYTVSVNDPAQRIHDVEQAYGPLTHSTTFESAPFNFLFNVEPAFVAAFNQQFMDTLRSEGPGAPPPPNVPYGVMPGGNLATYNLQTEFGFLRGHLGFASGGLMDLVEHKYWLVPAGTPVPPVVVDLVAFGANYDTPTNTLQFVLTNFAQDGGAAIALTSSNPAVLSVPASLAVPQGYHYSPAYVLPTPNIDVPTSVTLTASFNGKTQQQVVTVNPSVPLILTSYTAGLVLPLLPTAPRVVLTGFNFNRINTQPATVTLTSSNPALCPIQASLTIPALVSQFDPNFFSTKSTCSLLSVDTPITFTATFNGTTLSTTITVPKNVDTVAVSKAELVVKNLSLKVEASSTIPSAVLTLYNAANNQLIGTMTNTGLSGGGAKYSFQGTLAAPVTTVLLKSSFNGTATGAVSQK